MCCWIRRNLSVHSVCTRKMDIRMLHIYIYIRLLAVQLISVRVAHYRPNHVYETLICIANIFQVFSLFFIPSRTQVQ